MKLLLTFLCGLSLHAQSAHWNQFRGPNGSGALPGARPPIRFDGAKPTWTANVPPAHSSPVIWADRIFLTGVENGRLVTLALNASDGKRLWLRSTPKVDLAKVHRAGSNAASTPCADAERVYSYFGSFGLICHDHDGKELWHRTMLTPKSMYGMSTSPILHDGKVVLVLDNDNNLKGSRLSRSTIVAFSCETGKTVWETGRPYNRSGWSTPVVWSHKSGTDIAVLGNGRAYGYDAASGEERWYVNGFSRETIATPVIGNDRLHLSASRQGGWGDADVDPLPFWKAVLPFDKNGDGRIGRDEITRNFTIPFRPELPIGHPGYGLPLPEDPKRRHQRQLTVFNWRDKNKDGFWTKSEFMEDMKVGRGHPNFAAINPGGRGDITESHTAWNLRTGIPEIPSPLYHDGRLYLIRAGGVLTCVKADTGEVIYRERLGAAGQYSPSPIIANGHLFIVSSRGILSVVKAGDDFEVVQQTDLRSEIPATSALDRDTIYLRTTSSLVSFRRGQISAD
jgi:outer membrane protein assembly factor BamB